MVEDLLFSEATGLAFSQKGVVIINGEEVFVEQVPSKDVEDWRKLKGLETGDQRLLGNHTDASGKKRLELSAAVSLMKGPTENSDEFPIAGVRAAKECHEAVALDANSIVSVSGTVASSPWSAEAIIRCSYTSECVRRASHATQLRPG